MIDRQYPHQIILLADHCSGDAYYTIAYFCEAEGLSLAPRKHQVFKQDRWHYVYCFREKQHAETFKSKFGGEWFDPATRDRGRRWHLLREPKRKRYN